jgi:hypothetical protein
MTLERFAVPIPVMALSRLPAGSDLQLAKIAALL